MLVRDRGSWAAFLQDESIADPPITAFWWALLPPCLHPWGTSSGPTLISVVLQSPSPSHRGKCNSLPSAALQGWREDGAGGQGETLCHQTQPCPWSQPRPQKC